ncbi:uncharacterized protein LOC143082740 [Mytilus galloprovincialis]|uniref:uncharacterized protein LOC143082740 n=1 Tax=Mytilus galloprovincialis TaxID=29158 RepID=UPI003F7C232C
MRRESLPMRVRRRQSDAKWRASVATCYETLKHVIPDCDKISKRKISKALILQETEKHINNLENVLSDILSDKARSRGKVVLYQTEQGLVEANMADVQQDLVLKQQNMYLHNFGQRKRSNIPSDIETGIINLRSTYCPLTVLPTECLQQQVVPSTPNDEPNNRQLEENRENIFIPGFNPIVKPTERVHLTHFPFEHLQTVPQQVSLLKTPVKSKSRTDHASSCVKNFEYHAPGEVTPNKAYSYLSRTPKNSHKRQHYKTPGRISTKLKPETCSRFTPVKHPGELDHGTPQQLPSVPTGFTPIKLPTEFGTPSQFSDVPLGYTPIKMSVDSMLPESPFTSICMKSLSPDSKERLDHEYAWSEQMGLTSLLCDETIDHMDLGDEDDLAEKNSRTPQNSIKPKEKRHKIAEKGKKFRSLSSSSSGGNSVQTSHSGGKGRNTEAKCRRQLEKCFTAEKDSLPVITGVFDNTDTNCLDFDGYFLFYQFVAGDKEETLKGEMASEVSQMWKEMPEDTKDTFIAMAALEGSQSDSSHLSDDLIELDVKPFDKDNDDVHHTFHNDVHHTFHNEEVRPNQVMFSVKQEPQILLPQRPIPKSYHFLLPEHNVQEVPLGRVVLPKLCEQILVPEISEQVTVPDTSEAAVVPEFTMNKPYYTLSKPVMQMPEMDHMIGQNVEVSAEMGDFQMVPESQLCHFDRSRANDLGFISLSNENSMNEEFQHVFSPQITTEDLTEWKGQIVPLV